ncbi:MAG: PadR family transcriptional regulator [Clostridiales bacterium]|nr:PadR family transcriptional regulator [Clostridiales bacterium]
MARKQLKTLTEPMYYILLCLLKPMHGYGIMQRIDEITGSRVKVGPGTLYALISRFEKEEIVIKVSSDNGKKTYILTEKGKEILMFEYNRLNQLVCDGAVLRGETDES